MKNNKLELLSAQLSILGEGPVWDHRNKVFIWVDIERNEVHQYDEERCILKTSTFTKKITAVAVKKGGGYVASVEDGFADIDLQSGTIQMISSVNEPGNRFNDGKCDPQGRFWAGTKCGDEFLQTANVYSFTGNNTFEIKLAGVSVSNGMAWSPDEKIFYYIDTPNRYISRFAYEKDSGNLSNREIVYKINEGYPDGMTIDEEGMLWVALWDGWKVIRIDPGSGKLLEELRLPVARVTSCAFGGKNMDDLFITSARAGLTEMELLQQPNAGAVFIWRKSGFKGAKVYEYKE